ncbi:hypothetical protein ACFE04_031796 [Oxalis oulophora]
MGNATGRVNPSLVNHIPNEGDLHAPNSDSDDLVPMMMITNINTPPPPQSPSLSPSPQLVPMQRVEGSPLSSNSQSLNESAGTQEEKGVPTIISWTFGGNSVAVEGSWDNWKSRKLLQRSGKDHSLLLVLPEGIYHYRFIVDGQSRYIPDLPSIPDETGHICNVLDVDDYVPENLDSVAEFEAPPSPESSYSQSFPTEDDFAKEPAPLPPQFHLAAVGKEDINEASPPSKPRHVMINHLYMEKGCESPSVVAVGLTHRFQSKYVTAVLYKPLHKQ